MGVIISEVLDLDNLEFTDEEIQTGAELLTGSEEKKEGVILGDALKVVELFAGIGTQRMALKVLDIKHKVVAMSEIDKYAIQSYNLIHGETPNLGDVSKIVPSEVPDCDLLTYSFPCTDCSVSGNQLGLQEGSGTASSLLWYCKGIIEAKKPKYLLMENVKNLLGKNHYKYFQEWCNVLIDLGYTNYYKVLNAKHYGVPQNRERVFMVSILGEYEPYQLPDLEDVSTCIEDILEANPDKKYYLAEDNKKKFIENIKEAGLETALEKINSTEKSTQTVNIGNMYNNKYDSQAGRIYGRNGVSPTLSTMNGGNRQPKIIEGKFDPDNLDSFELRKLTPLECWRLMGVNDFDYAKVKDVMSDTQLYKQAGNAIVVDVLVEIFKNLF